MSQGVRENLLCISIQALVFLAEPRAKGLVKQNHFSVQEETRGGEIIHGSSANAQKAEV